MSFPFEFRGRTLKRDNKIIKFHAFIRTTDGEEDILFSAVGKGFVDHDKGTDTYFSAFPLIKIFSSTSGFGIRKAYQSYFFKLDSTSNREVLIKPLGYEHLGSEELFFRGLGYFLTPQEIKETVGEDTQTYKFYLRQTVLSKRELQELIEVNYITASGKAAKVRHIRF